MTGNALLDTDVRMECVSRDSKKIYNHDYLTEVSNDGLWIRIKELNQ